MYKMTNFNFLDFFLSLALLCWLPKFKLITIHSTYLQLIGVDKT